MYYKVFLDTNIYDGANYSFHNAMFSTLRKMAESGDLQLKINSVVEGEVKKYISRDVKAAAKKLLESVKDRSLSSFHNIPSFQEHLIIPNPGFRKQISSRVSLVHLQFSLDLFVETSVFIFCNQKGFHKSAQI